MLGSENTAFFQRAQVFLPKHVVEVSGKWTLLSSVASGTLGLHGELLVIFGFLPMKILPLAGRIMVEVAVNS